MLNQKSIHNHKSVQNRLPFVEICLKKFVRLVISVVFLALPPTAVCEKTNVSITQN
jgi:hypothetical protein